MSSESTVIPPPAAGGAEPCINCGVAMAPDQRYCLECGTRRADLRSLFLDSHVPRPGEPPPAAPPPTAPMPAMAPPPRSNATAVIAGVGVLLLAMGVGVLIGRAGGGTPKTIAAAPAQVISVGGPAAGSATTPTAASATFTDDWPAGTDGYTVQLQTLPESSTQPPAVAAAKGAATAKGAPKVGALKSDDFGGLTPGEYVIYSGVYTKQADAQKALGKLHGFPGAKVVHVSGGGAAAGTSASTTTPSGSSPISHANTTSANPTAPAIVNQLRQGSGQSYQQKSKSLPNSISIGK